MDCGLTVDQTFELSWYELYLLIERVKQRNENEKIEQELEWVRLSHLIANTRNCFGGKGGGVAYRAEDFYTPSWSKKEIRESKPLTSKEIKEKFGTKFLN